MRLKIGKGDIVIDNISTYLDLIKYLNNNIDKARELGIQNIISEVIAVKVKGELKDLSSLVEDGSEIEFIVPDSNEGLEIIRHSTSHLMAQAVLRLYPDAKFGIGPAIENGFYYDIDTESKINDSDLERIEEEMRKIVKEDYTFTRKELTKEEAIEFFKSRNQHYKIELINEIEADRVSVYTQGEFSDLCRGPHVPSTRKLKAFKLHSVAGAYWRGNSKNKMLQRIYGYAFDNEKKLKDYLKFLEEAERRDHRKIGKEMELFMLSDYGPGFPFFLPRGMVIRNELENFWREKHKQANYLEIKTPIILNRELWETSGHWFNYKENMYTTTIDEIDNAIKPMNCPGAILVYKQNIHSYKELPLRIGELGLVHRHELSGVLHGLFRVRAFTQDDAHIFMSEDQIEQEIIGVIDLIDEFYRKIFNFDYEIHLSTKPENRIGSDEIWEKATKALENAVKHKNLSYKINEGDGAFYGPKLDFKIKDSIGRTWQCGTIQLDFNLPERFDISYIGPDGAKHRPVMIHRVIYGSLERFIGILIEHYAGKFPLWLSPIQVKILPVSDKFNEYAFKIEKILKDSNIRVLTDDSSEKLGYKIRKAQLEKANYMLVIGEKEVENNTISVRHRDKGDIGSKNINEFITNILEEIKNKM